MGNARLVISTIAILFPPMASAQAPLAAQHARRAPSAPVVTWQSVSAGWRHTCGATTDGRLYCWGSNEEGELGADTVRKSDVPLQVARLSGPGLRVTVGGLSACALAGDSVAACWGRGAMRGLAGADSRTPVAPTVGIRFRELSLGYEHGCAVTVDSAAYCWDRNQQGELGIGSVTAGTTPQAVAGGVKFGTVRVGRGFSCGLDAAGAAYCWGLELGTRFSPTSLVPVPVFATLRFTAIAAGHSHACGIATSGRVYCWGSNTHGELGVAPDVLRGVSRTGRPFAVSDSTFDAISAGLGFTCALTRGGTAYCWGRNEWGQLGDGTRTDRASPTRVAGRLSFRSISAGADHVCAIATDGALYCWGLNEAGATGAATGAICGVSSEFEQPCNLRPARVVNPR